MISVYVAHPVRGSVDVNVAKARAWFDWLVSHHGHSHAFSMPWVEYVRTLNDNDPAQRAMGMAASFKLLERCEELWLVGSRISDGMHRETLHAFARGLRVFDYTGVVEVPHRNLGASLPREIHAKRSTVTG